MKVQLEIMEKLKVKPYIKPREEIEKRINFIKEYLKNNTWAKTLILGISGGQDSTIAGKLCQMAVNELNDECKHKKYKFIAVRLPYGNQKDEDDCVNAIEFINPDKTLTVDIKPSVDTSVEVIEKATNEKISDFLKGNEKARERMKVQYTLAGKYKGLVVGTDHAAEAVMGFYTKYGDGACDITPLYGLNKRQGKKILKELGGPESIYNKKPTADLEDERPQLSDEDALGVKYDVIDDYLEGKRIDQDSKNIIERAYIKTEHKRKLPVTMYDYWWK